GAAPGGMSTPLEAIAARAAGLEIFGLSMVTNAAAGITGEKLNHEEVLAAGKAAAGRLGGVLVQFLGGLPCGARSPAPGRPAGSAPGSGAACLSAAGRSAASTSSRSATSVPARNTWSPTS